MTNLSDITEFASVNRNRYINMKSICNFFTKIKQLWTVLQEYDLYNGRKWDDY